MVSAEYKIQGMKKTYVEAVAAAKGVLRSTITKSFVTSFVPKRLFPLGRLTFRGQIIESSKGQSLESLPGRSLSWQRLLSTSSLWRSAFSSASPASPSRQPNPQSEEKLLNILSLSLEKKLVAPELCFHCRCSSGTGCLCRCPCLCCSPQDKS